MGLLDQIMNGGISSDTGAASGEEALLADLFRRLQSGDAQATAVSMSNALGTASQSAPLPKRELSMPGQPYSPPPANMVPNDIAARTPPPQPTAQMPAAGTREPTVWDRMGALSRGYDKGGLIGGIADAMGGVDKQAAEQNATAAVLAKRLGDPELASLIAKDPQLLRSVIPNLFAPKDANLQVTEIYDANGRKQKALFNPRTGQTQPIGGTEALSPTASLTPAQRALDQKFGKDYSDFMSGGFADVEKGLTQLRSVAKELRDPNGPNLTGPVLGMMPDRVTAFTNPAAIDRREQVEEVVQRNLRAVLGAQFTQKEGDRLIARAYNPSLSEAENADRLDRLILSIEKAYAAKQAAAQHFEKNGTLSNYTGTANFSIDDIERDIDGPAPKSSGGKSGGAPRVPTDGASVRVNSVDEARRLAPGTRFVDPNGIERVR